MTETALTCTRRLLEEEVAAGLLTKGAQVCVVVGNDIHELSLGDAGTGGPVNRTTVFKVYCAIKPIAVVAIAKQVEAGTLSLDEPMRDLLPAYRVLGDHDITLRHVLSHSAGLHVPPTIELELLAPPLRQRRLETAELPAGWRVGIDAAYSEYFGWHLLGELLEVVSGQPLREHLRSAVLDPLGMTSTWIGMTPDEYEQTLPRLGLSWRLDGPRTTPMLLEQSRRWCTETNCASGGYTCALDFARFYAALAHQLNYDCHPHLPSRDTLRMFCATGRPRAYDQVLARECDYGHGVMIHLNDHFFGRRCSDDAFGQTGLAGSSFAFADPTCDLGAAIILNGVIDGPASLLRRQNITDAIYDDVSAT